MEILTNLEPFTVVAWPGLPTTAGLDFALRNGREHVTRPGFPSIGRAGPCRDKLKIFTPGRAV